MCCQEDNFKSQDVTAVHVKDCLEEVQEEDQVSKQNTELNRTKQPLALANTRNLNKKIHRRDDAIIRKEENIVQLQTQLQEMGERMSTANDQVKDLTA